MIQVKVKLICIYQPWRSGGELLLLMTFIRAVVQVNFVQVVSAGVFALMLSHLLQLETFATTSGESTTRPNIVLIMADDRCDDGRRRG